MKKLRVELGERSYDILIGQNIFSHLPRYLGDKKTFIITDENVAKLHLEKLQTELKIAGIKNKVKILPAGEGTKSFKNLEKISEWLLKYQPERKTTIIALGGGVIGDLVGFCASVVLRGVNFIQIPTTLLSQVDSSVGGKTAINSKFGKNLIGSFYQPKLVMADSQTLETLPKREFKSGYAEILKYGLINKPDFFTWLDKHDLVNPENLNNAIYTSCQAKAEIVAKDEREGGVRALLNFGHTFGHALEAETGFSSKLLHGEAVALGMLMAFKLSQKLGHCPASEVAKLLAHYDKMELPTDPLEYVEKWDVDSIIESMKSDKKVKNGKMVFILTRGIGQAFIEENVDEESLREFLQTYGDSA